MNNSEKRLPLEKFFEITPKFFSKYKQLNNKWNKEPQEVFLRADLEMRIYLGLGLFTWLISGFSLIFFLISMIQKEKGPMVGWTIAFCILAYSGFVLMRLSNKKEAQSNLEKMKYREALMNKKTTVRRLQEIETICLRSVRENITRHTFTQYLDDKETYIKLFQKLISVVQDSIEDLTKVYETNKYYDYNINEQVEIEVFYTVDAFKEYEIMTNNLSNVDEDLNEILLLMKKNKEPFYVVNKIELLLDNIKNEKVKI